MTFPVAIERRTFLRRTGSAAILMLAATASRVWAQAAPIKIGIIGSGKLGGTVGGLWVKAGHPVLFSSRHPEELKGLVDGLGPLAKAGSVEEAVSFGDAVLIAVPYGALPQVGKDYAKELAGKVVIDACNAVAQRDGDIAKEVAEKGIGVTSAQYLPGTRLVRAFNAMSFRKFEADSQRAGDRIAVPIAGDDPEALKVVAGLVRDAGFDPVAVPLARAGEFAVGSPLYLQELTATELRQRLGLTQ
jgi:8-hydroxy-5-deazaflavin:NADPH oxidoreductase